MQMWPHHTCLKAVHDSRLLPRQLGIPWHGVGDADLPFSPAFITCHSLSQWARELCFSWNLENVMCRHLVLCRLQMLYFLLFPDFPPFLLIKIFFIPQDLSEVLPSLGNFHPFQERPFLCSPQNSTYASLVTLTGLWSGSLLFTCVLIVASPASECKLCAGKDCIFHLLYMSYWIRYFRAHVIHEALC